MNRVLRRSLHATAVVGAALCAALLLGEGLARVLGLPRRPPPSPVRIADTKGMDIRPGTLSLHCFPSNPRGYFQIDLRRKEVAEHYERIGMRNMDKALPGTPWAVEMKYNSAGYRGPEIPARRPGIRRVVVLGDSFNLGWGRARRGHVHARSRATPERAAPGRMGGRQRRHRQRRLPPAVVPLQGSPRLRARHRRLRDDADRPHPLAAPGRARTGPAVATRRFRVPPARRLERSPGVATLRARAAPVVPRPLLGRNTTAGGRPSNTSGGWTSWLPSAARASWSRCGRCSRDWRGRTPWRRRTARWRRSATSSRSRITTSSTTCAVGAAATCGSTPPSGIRTRSPSAPWPRGWRRSSRDCRRPRR